MNREEFQEYFVSEMKRLQKKYNLWWQDDSDLYGATCGTLFYQGEFGDETNFICRITNMRYPEHKPNCLDILKKVLSDIPNDGEDDEEREIIDNIKKKVKLEEK